MADETKKLAEFAANAMCGSQNDPFRDELTVAVDTPFFSIFLKCIRVNQQPGPLQWGNGWVSNRTQIGIILSKPNGGTR